ncbi:MAG: VOC family protein [Rhodocyclaceae bacterium]|nr:VOC family protein [Rhodocyclaceae bacterium]
MTLEPYLTFNGRCEEALQFYVRQLDAEVTALMRFADAPEHGAGCAPGPQPAPDKIMHACLRIGDATLMASDGMADGPPRFEGFALTLAVEDEASARRRFEALGDGGQILMPLAPTFFAHQFGMVADRFGVSWMVIIPRDA